MHSDVSWRSYADKLAQIKAKVAAIAQELNDLRVIASPWQKIAIDQVKSLLQELAGNTQLAITKLNKNPDRIHMPPCNEYVAAHYNLATDLASMIGDFVEYGKSKAKLEALTWKLELPEQ